jgi:hypothetical protein
MTPSSPSPHESTLTRTANGLVIGMARHWLAIFNTVWAVYLFTPFLGADLHADRLDGARRRHLCDLLCALPSVARPQLLLVWPVAGTPITGTDRRAAWTASASLFVERAFIGSPTVGWKVALCQRDVAIYAGVLLAGISYAFVRRRARPLPFKVFVLLVHPDGGRWSDAACGLA